MSRTHLSHRLAVRLLLLMSALVTFAILTVTPTSQAASLYDGMPVYYWTAPGTDVGDADHYNIRDYDVTTMCPHVGVDVPRNGTYNAYDLDVHPELIASPSSGVGVPNSDTAQILKRWKIVAYYAVGGPGYAGGSQADPWWNQAVQIADGGRARRGKPGLGSNHESHVLMLMHELMGYVWLGNSYNGVPPVQMTDVMVDSWGYDDALQALSSLMTQLEARAAQENAPTDLMKIYMLNTQGAGQEIVFWNGEIEDRGAFIEIVKKNMELGKNGTTVAAAGFRFKLYDALDKAQSETGALEEATTNASGVATFTTNLAVSNAADPSAGTYYVRESAAIAPYNKSNAIYKFVITSDGNGGNVSYSVQVMNPTGKNSPYGGTFVDYPNGNGIAVHDSTAAGFSGPGVKNVCPTTVEDAPQYGRIKITKTDSGDGSLQQGAEYQVYAEKEVTYTSQGLVWTPENAGTSQRTPTAGTDNVSTISGETIPTGYTKTSSYSVNTHPAVAGADASKIRRVANTDVARTTKIPAGSSTFDAATGKVTVTNPVVFTRADGTTYDTIITDANGTATTGWLPIDATGTTRYFIVETKTSNGHVIDGTRFYADLKYDASLQDRECVIASKWTSNNQKVSQADRPNEIDIVKTTLPSPANPNGGVLAGVTVGMWKDEDDIKVSPQASDGTYAFDAIAIRTQSTDLVPSVHQRVVGSEVVLSALPDGYVLRLLNGEKVVYEGSAIGDSATIASGAYKVSVTDATGSSETGMRVTGLTKVTLGEGDRIGIAVSIDQDASSSVSVAAESSPIELRDSNLTYDASRDVWIATNLKAGADYEVEFRRHVVKVIHTSATGGHTWFGRYAEADLTWFANGWLDQAALPTSDSRIITSASMSYAPDERFTTNTTPLTTGNDVLRTTNNQTWLQDTSAARTYQYATVTDANGSIVNYRIGAGTYVLAEVKPPVDYDLHKTWLPDTVAHHFTVDDVTGYITDTDNATIGYAADRHDADSHKPEQGKHFAFADDVTKLKISKWEMTNAAELVGAELVLTADNNDEVDRWVSGDEPHYIEGLLPGWYYLTEYVTPKDYDKAETIRFNLLPTGEVQHEAMYDAPIYIRAEIDKHQEIATPLNEGDYVDGDSKNHASPQGNNQGLYAYSIDFRSNSNTWTDEFTVEDPLPAAKQGLARLVSVVTPQAWQDYDGKMNVWYKTNLTPSNYIETLYDAQKSGFLPYDGNEPLQYAANATLEDGHENPLLAVREVMAEDTDGDSRIVDYVGWRLWRKGVSASVATKLDVSDLGLKSNEYVTGVRLEYGRVEPNFTTRVEGWDGDMLHYEHDDYDRIHGLSSQSFQAAEKAAEAAIARMNIVTARFTTDASFIMESAVAEERRQAKEDYDQKLISIDEYNEKIKALSSDQLPKFADALAKPAYTDDADDVIRLDTASEAAKSSLQASFVTATTTESRSVLLSAARQVAADVEGTVSSETLHELNQKIRAYETEVSRLPSEAGGYDMDRASEELLSACMSVIDDIRESGLSGRVMYAPAVLQMQVTKEYTAGVVLRNTARVDAYRNGGDGREYPSIRTTLTNKATGDHAVGASGLVTVSDDVAYYGLTPGQQYVMSGELHLKSADDEDLGVLYDDDVPVTATKTFVPEDTRGTVQIEFSFHAELLDGTDLVAFEECRLVRDYHSGDTSGSDNDVVAEHRDIRDVRQMVNEKGDFLIPETPSPEGHDDDEVTQMLRRKTDEAIATTLSSPDGQKVVSPDVSGTMTLVDTVEYHNLIPGKSYQLNGVLHMRGYDAASRSVTDCGIVKGSGGSTIFTPEQPDGVVEVRLVVPESEVLFMPVVAFEELRAVSRETGVVSDLVLATHKDIASEAQAVNVTTSSEDVTRMPLLQAGGKDVLVATFMALISTIGCGCAYLARQNMR